MPSASDGVLVVLADLGGQGGLQDSYRALVTGLAARRPVTVLTWGASFDPGLPADVDVLRAQPLVAWDRDHSRALAAANTAMSVTTATAAALRASKWGVALAAGLNPEGLVAAAASIAQHRPFVLDTWLPGPLGNVARLRASPLFPAHARVLRRAHAVLAGTDEVADELSAAGFPADRVRLVHRGIDLEAVRPASGPERAEARRHLGLDPDRPVVAYWGRFDLRHKRLDVLLDAWASAALDGWQLVLAGDGPDRAILEQRAATISLRPAPLFPGWLEDIGPLRAAADVFAFPTEFEATGFAMVEGLASGLPGVVSATDRLLRYRPGGTLLVPNDVGAWAGALRQLAEAGVEGRRRLGASARAWSEGQTSVATTVAEVDQLLSASLRRRG